MATHTPVSLPLTNTLPPAGSSILPPSISSHLPIPTSGNNTTKILLLSNFSPELKTRDIQQLFGEWEELGGGFKIKWSDDVSCWIVFNDAAVAKRAFLSLLSSPPPALIPTPTHTPRLTPYTGPDSTSILQAVQNRPRSRSVTNHSHSRKGSLLGSGGGSALVNRNSSGGAGSGGNGSGNGGGAGLDRRGSRGSFGQKQLREAMEGYGTNGEERPPVPEIPSEHAVSDSPTEEKEKPTLSSLPTTIE